VGGCVSRVGVNTQEIACGTKGVSHAGGTMPLRCAPRRTPKIKVRLGILVEGGEIAFEGTGRVEGIHHLSLSRMHFQF